MSALWSQLLLKGLVAPGRGLLRPPRAQLHAKVARDQVGPLETSVGLTSCFLCVLLPAAWVLSNLESYKKRE